VFGIGDGGLADLVKNIADDAITSVMTGAIVPLATEAIWTFSGLAWLEILLHKSVACSALWMKS
jgi:hypothetical protein